MEACFTFPPKFGALKHDPAVSGFSPVDRSFPRVRQYSNATAHARFARDDYQRQELYGFTTRELADLDVITDRRLRENNLPAKIHPIFERQNWQTGPHELFPKARLQNMPPGFGGNGKWSADNDIIWNAILPSIQIVSMLLERIHCMPWFTALLADPIPEKSINFRELVDLDRIRPKDKWQIQHGPDPWEINDLLTFSCRVPLSQELRDATQKKLDIIWGEIAKNYEVQIGIKSTNEDPWDYTHPVPGTVGVSMTACNVAFMFYSISLIAPLLRNDLTDCERKGVQYHLATIMFHELMHVIYQIEVNLNYRKRHSMHEPYFGTNPIAECGFSAEFTAFGASPHPMLHENGEEFKSPLGYWIFTNFNAVDWVPRTTHFILTEPQLEDMQTFFPIKASLFEDMQREEFWNVGIDAFGLEILHSRSLIEGTLVVYNGLGPRNEVDLKLIHESAAMSIRFNHPVERMRRFRERLKALMDSLGKNVNPHQRKLAEFGWRVIHNSIWEEDFWRYSNDMSVYVDKMLPTLTYVFDVSVPETTNQTVARLLDFLQTTRVRHQAAVDSLLMIERTSSIKDTARRIQLLNWNRGARIYAMEILELASSSGIDTSSQIWDDEIIGLEFARLCLYDSSVYWHVPTLLDEEESITKAYIAIEAGAEVGDISHFQAAYDHVSPYILRPPLQMTLFTKACALTVSSTFPEVIFPNHAIAEKRVQPMEKSLLYARMAVAILESVDAFHGRMLAKAGDDLRECYTENFTEREEEYRSWTEDARASVARLQGLIAARNAVTVAGLQI